MKKALFFSLLLHGLLLFMGLRFFPPIRKESGHYKTLAVSLVQLPVKVEPDIVQPEEVVPARVILDKVTPFVPEKTKPESSVIRTPALIPDGTDTGAVKSDIIEVQDSPGSESAGQEEMIEVEIPGIAPVEYTETKTSGLSDKGDRLGISWSGGDSRKLLSGDSPDIHISRNSSLMDRVLIHFSVNSDGYVFDVKIDPPGSTDLKVDQQLMAWARLLVFDKDERNTDNAQGIITINLLGREISPR